MICHPCRHPHTAADCVDTAAGRTGTGRHCCCQHRPPPAPPGAPTDREHAVSMWRHTAAVVDRERTSGVAR